MHLINFEDPKPKAKVSKREIRLNTVKPNAAKVLEVTGNTLGVTELAVNSKVASFIRAGRAASPGLSKTLAVGGKLLGGGGIVVEAIQYGNGEMSGLEFGVDTTIALAAIFVSGPAAPFVAVGALLYFGGKAVYEYSSGITLFTKPIK